MLYAASFTCHRVFTKTLYNITKYSSVIVIARDYSDYLLYYVKASDVTVFADNQNNNYKHSYILKIVENNRL